MVNIRGQYTVLDPDTGEVLVSRGGQKQKSPASMTKALALYVISEAIASPSTDFNLNSLVTVPDLVAQRRYIQKRAAAFYRVKPGQKHTVRDLLIGAGGRSDAKSIITLAIATADAYGWKGTEAEKYARFVDKMNETADRLGMRNSRFSNAVGFKEGGKTYSTADDMALLFAALYKDHPKLATHALGQEEFNIPKLTGSTSHTSIFANLNPRTFLLGKTGSGADGKTEGLLAKVNGKIVAIAVMGARSIRSRTRLINQAIKETKTALANNNRTRKTLWAAVSPPRPPVRSSKIARAKNLAAERDFALTAAALNSPFQIPFIDRATLVSLWKGSIDSVQSALATVNAKLETSFNAFSSGSKPPSVTVVIPTENQATVFNVAANDDTPKDLPRPKMKPLFLAAQAAKGKTIVVKAGSNLTRIVNKHFPGLSDTAREKMIDAVADQNRVHRDRIKAGQKLILAA